MPSSGPYKSHVFNLLLRQGRRLREQVNTALRWGKLGLTWGTQVLLYPIYVAFQGSRLVGRQFGSVVQRLRLRLQAVGAAVQPVTRSPVPPPLTADAPVRTVLRAVHAIVQSDVVVGEWVDEEESGGYGVLTLAYSNGALPGRESVSSMVLPAATPGIVVAERGAFEANQSGTLTQVQDSAPVPSLPWAVQRVVIRGIACELTSRRLVFVTPENRLVSGLTELQERRLQERIAAELATYWQHQRRLHQAQQPLNRFLPPPVERESLLPPVRLFRRLMGWVQTGPVAIAANLFQEADLRLSPIHRSLNGAIPPVKHNDRHRLPLQLPAAKIPPSLVSPAPSWKPLMASLRSPTPDGLPPSGSELPGRSPQPIPAPPETVWSRPNPPAHAMGPEPIPLPHQGQSPILSFVNFVELPQPAPATPPMSMERSQPGRLQQTPRRQLVHRHRNALSRRSSYSSAWMSGDRGSGDRMPNDWMPNDRMPDLEHLSPIPPLPFQKAASSMQHQSPVELGEPHYDDQAIDTPVVLVGYVKHPLERVLGWLDGGMAWLEQWATQLWQWVKRLSR